MKKLCTTLALFAIAICSFAQSSLQTALDLLLKQNKRDQAIPMLVQLTNSPQDGPNALLTLAMLEGVNEHYEKSFEYLQRFLEKSDNPYPYIYAFWSSGAFSSSRAGKNMLQYLEKVMKDPNTPLTVQAMAAGNLANARLNKGDFKECRKLYDNYGELSNWSTVGVFENVSGSGFNKDYGVLAHPEKTYKFTNNKGVDVTWFNMDHNLGHWYDFEYHYGISNALIYAQTFAKSPEDRKVVVKVGVSGSFKLWINDYLVASESEERNTNLDVYNYVVNLKKGNNRVLIQLGSAEIDNSNFMVRFADLQNHLITDLVSQPDYSEYEKEKGYDVQKLPFFAEEFFEKKLQKSPDSFLDLMLLISVYNQNDKRYEARKIAQKLKQLYPVSTLVAEKVTESYSRDNNNTDLTREIESIKTNDPESLYGLILRFNESMNKEDYTEAWDLLDRTEKLYGISRTIVNNRIRILANKKEYDELIKLLNKAYEQYPDDEDFTTMQYYIVLNSTKDSKKSASILQSFLNRNYDESIYNLLASSYLENGKKDEAFKMYRKYIENFPFATNKYSTIADQYFSMQEYGNAIEWIDKAIERAPYVGNYYYKKGLIIEAQGKKTEALKNMQAAIRYSPGNFDARKKVRELEGKKELFSYFGVNDMAEIVKNAPAASQYPNDHSIYLLDDMQQVVYPENGASEEKYELVVKVFNAAGIDYWKEVSIPYNYYTEKLIIEKAELLKKDGTKVQSETNDNEVVFSSLEVGDVVHILYRKEIVYTGKLSEHFWEEYTFNGGLPAVHSRYRLIVPKERKFSYRLYNSDIQPRTSDVDDYKLYVWEKKNMPAVKSEPYMPAYTDINERIVVTSIPDWSYVANWYRDLSSIKAKGDFEVKEKVSELLAGKKNLSDLEKAKLFYTFIEENFSYSDVAFLHSALTPQKASRTLQTKLGDCKDLSTLFVAMCQEAGIDASLVLVDTRENGEKHLDLPTIGFNHCIAQVKTGGKNYLVELTNKTLPFGSLSPILLNANALYIPKESETEKQGNLVKLSTPNRPFNTVDREMSLTFAGSTATIVRKSKRSGSEASGIREEYRDRGDEDNRKDLSESLTNEFTKKVVLKDLQITNLDNLADTLTFLNSFTVDNYSNELVGMQVFRLPWTDSYKALDFISAEKRQYPFAFWKFSSTPYDREVMTIALPKGKKLAEVPANVSFSCSSMSYSLTFKVLPDKIIATREVKYLKEFMAPAEFAPFKDFITKMNEADNKQYAWK